MLQIFHRFRIIEHNFNLSHNICIQTDSLEIRKLTKSWLNQGKISYEICPLLKTKFCGKLFLSGYNS